MKQEDPSSIRKTKSIQDELISLSIRLDCHLHERRRERSGRVRHTPPVVRTMSPPLRGLTPSPLTPSCPDRIPPRTAPSPPGPEEPMQLGRTRLTPRERQHRHLHGLCVYCGQDGHQRVHCPALPKGGGGSPTTGRALVSQSSICSSPPRLVIKGTVSWDQTSRPLSILVDSVRKRTSRCAPVLTLGGLNDIIVKNKYALPLIDSAFGAPSRSYHFY